MHKVVLLRHGESTWNMENRFTGWTDVDLSERGFAESHRVGQLLKAEGSASSRQTGEGAVGIETDAAGSEVWLDVVDNHTAEFHKTVNEAIRAQQPGRLGTSD